MQIKNLLLTFIFSIALVQAQTVDKEPRCDDNLETYDSCIADASAYQQREAAGNPPNKFSRTTQCYYCFVEAEQTCGEQYGTDPDTLSDEGKACYNENMKSCQKTRGERCKWVLRSKEST